nr:MULTISPECIES: hypothetical protein [Paracoccus]
MDQQLAYIAVIVEGKDQLADANDKDVAVMNSRVPVGDGLDVDQ